MNNGGRRQFFFCYKKKPPIHVRTQFQYFYVKFHTQKTFFKIVTWITSELFTYQITVRKKITNFCPAYRRQSEFEKFAQVQMFTSSISQQSSEDCLYARRQTWIFGPKTNSFFMYTIANNNMDGECDRQAKQNIKKNTPSRHENNV